MKNGNEKLDFRKKILYVLVNGFDSCVEKYVVLPRIFLEKLNFQLILSQDPLNDDYPPHAVVLFRTITNLEPILTKVTALNELKIPIRVFFDDLLPVVYPHNLTIFKALLSKTTEVIVTTETLKEWFSNYHSNVVQIPTFIETNLMNQTKPIILDPNKKTIISAQTSEITQLIELFTKISSSNFLKYLFKDVQFLIIQASIAKARSFFAKFHQININLLEYCSLPVLYGLIKGSYLLLATGHENDLYFVPPEYRTIWLNSKSCIKYLMAMSAKVPFVGSANLLEYVKNVKNGQTGFVFSSIDECIEIFVTLLENETLRNRIVESAYQELDKWDEKNAEMLMERFTRIE